MADEDEGEVPRAATTRARLPSVQLAIIWADGWFMDGLWMGAISQTELDKRECMPLITAWHTNNDNGNDNNLGTICRGSRSLRLIVHGG